MKHLSILCLKFCFLCSMLFFTQHSFAQSGSLDLSFDMDGKVTTSVGTTIDVGTSMVVQPDGKILVGGYSYIGTGNAFMVCRYLSNGSLDTSFDADGKVTTTFGGSSLAHAIALQPDGKIILAGENTSATFNDFALIRYHPNGSLDTSFNGFGIVVTPIGSGGDVAYAVSIQADGKIVAGGYSNNGTNNDFALVRYNANGSLDSSFSSDGMLTNSIGISGDYIQSLAIQADGKIVAGGYANVGLYSDIALARYQTNGNLDSTFDGDGKLMTPIGSTNDNAATVLIQPDGKIFSRRLYFQWIKL